MKIKRYTATSMRAALDLVRAEQGPDAVILSSRRGEEGIEVIAAVDYDAGLFAAAKHQQAAAPAVPGSPVEAAPAADTSSSSRLDQAIEAALAARPIHRSTAAEPKQARIVRPPVVDTAAIPVAAKAAPVSRAPLLAPRATPPSPVARSQVPPANQAMAAAPRTSLTPPTAAPAAEGRPVPRPRAVPAPASSPSSAAERADMAEAGDGSFDLMQRELRAMRNLLETGMAGMTWTDKRLREPLKAEILETLSALDIAPDVAMSIAELAPSKSNLQDTRNIPLALLVKMLPFLGDSPDLSGGVTALVGPTGAGKTTTIAKLAARWCMKHGSRDLALVSTDAYRIGAREQLMTYARILDTNMYAANSGKELARLMERLSHKKLVLIDSAGMGPRDARLTEQLAALKLGAGQAKVLLALPAQAEAQALDDIVRAYAKANPAACIITKVDEAASLGGVLSAIIRHKLKIAYVCDGQRIPDDLHASQQRRIWLVKAAQALKRGAPRVPDEAYLARTFGRVPAHA